MNRSEYHNRFITDLENSQIIADYSDSYDVQNTPDYPESARQIAEREAKAWAHKTAQVNDLFSEAIGEMTYENSVINNRIALALEDNDNQELGAIIRDIYEIYAGSVFSLKKSTGLIRQEDM